MSLPKIVFSASLILVLGATATLGSSQWRGWIADTGPALIRAALNNWSGFSIETRAVTCVSGLPQVSLSWGSSKRAAVYLIQRQYPGGSEWEDVGESNTTQFTDKTYEPAYDLGNFGYRVQAQSPRKNTFSPAIKVRIADSAAPSPVTPPDSGISLGTTTLNAPTTTPTVQNPKPATKPVATTPKPTPTPLPGPLLPPGSVLTTSTPVIIPPASTPTPSPIPPVVTSGKLQWGAYVDDSTMGSFEALVGKPVNIHAVFVGWGHSDDFPTYMSAPVKAAGKTLLIFWEPSSGNSDNPNQPLYNYDSITSGSWDSYIRTFATNAKAYGGPIILAPFEEMNGDWYPWAGTTNGNTPSKAIAGWRHMHDIFVSVGALNVKWGWAPNSTSWPNIASNDLTNYYPGDAYVDYVGADGFNFNDDAWDSFSTMFNAALTKLEVYNKPIYLFSMASAEGTKKAAWITDAFAVQVPKHPKIAGWVWFNTNKEKDWRVNSDPAALAAFKAILP